VGGLQVAAGVGQIAAGITAVATGGGAVVGVLAIAHGLSDLAGGVSTFRKDEPQDIPIHQGAAKVAQWFGATKETAGYIGTAVDVAWDIGPGIGKAVAKKAAVRKAAAVAAAKKAAATEAAKETTETVVKNVAVEGTKETAENLAVTGTKEITEEAAPKVAAQSAAEATIEAAPKATASASSKVAKLTTQTATQLSEGELRVKVLDLAEKAIQKQLTVLRNVIRNQDVAFLQRLEFQDEIPFILNPSLGAKVHGKFFGQAIERMVARSLRSNPVIGKYFEYIAEPFVAGADWAGRRVLEGLEFDLTTFKGIRPHMRRYLKRGGPEALRRLIFWGYKR
jgi:hypothetical protein